MLPAFVALSELELRLPTPLGSELEQLRAQALLADASTLIREEAGRTWVTDAGALAEDLPDIIRMITIAVVKRGVANSDGVTQETTGSYSVSLANASPDLYLTATERRLVRKAAGKTGVWSMPTTRSIDDNPDLPCVDTTYPGPVAGVPVPWYPEPE